MEKSLENLKHHGMRCSIIEVNLSVSDLLTHAHILISRKYLVPVFTLPSRWRLLFYLIATFRTAHGLTPSVNVRLFGIQMPAMNDLPHI